MKLDAILWDYDGTLVNSVPKNIDITKNILSIVAPHLTGVLFNHFRSVNVALKRRLKG